MEISKLLKKRPIGIIFLILFSVTSPLIFFSCGGNNGENTSDINSGTPVTITHPVLHNMSEYLELNGNTVFLSKEIIRSTFDGFIVKVYKNIGDSVNRGDILFEIKTKESAANDTLSIKLGNQLFRGAVYVRANTNGVLSEVDYHAGDYVTGGEQIAIVSNPSSIRIKLNVPYEDVSKIKLGAGCEIYLPDGSVVQGIVNKNVPTVDPATQTQVYFIKPNSYKTLPENLNVMVKIPYKKFTNTIALPKSAVMTNTTEDTFWIMKLLNDTTAVRVNIKKGVENDSLDQILSPKLKTTDQIILTGAYGLPDTANVEITK